MFVWSFFLKVSDTYPADLFVPESATPPVIVGSSKFRSRGRFPALSYYCKDNHVSLLQSISLFIFHTLPICPIVVQGIWSDANRANISSPAQRKHFAGAEVRDYLQVYKISFECFTWTVLATKVRKVGLFLRCKSSCFTKREREKRGNRKEKKALKVSHPKANMSHCCQEIFSHFHVKAASSWWLAGRETAPDSVFVWSHVFSFRYLN